MKDSMNQEDLLRNKNLITSFVNNAILQTEGVSKQQHIKGDLKVRNVQVYFYNDEVTVDVFISVIFGFRVPEVVCGIQERVITMIKDNTKFKVKNVNVNVTNVIFM
ncbi:MAG TPA: Asp23/Gls24 family envelope stress response protein [Clostridia bacterium]|nr:Asp23/Gls24 family envelope stress response protein [Clostridia bacterium]